MDEIRKDFDALTNHIGELTQLFSIQGKAIMRMKELFHLVLCEVETIRQELSENASENDSISHENAENG